MLDLEPIKARNLVLEGAAPVCERYDSYPVPAYIVTQSDFDAVFECRKDVPALLEEVGRLRAELDLCEHMSARSNMRREESE